MHLKITWFQVYLNVDLFYDVLFIETTVKYLSIGVLVKTAFFIYTKSLFS